LRLHLERARDFEHGIESAWCTDYWQGEFLGRGWGWRELKEANKHPSHLKCLKTASKTHLLTLKNAENAYFTQNCLIRYTLKMFLRHRTLTFCVTSGYVELYLCRVLGVTYTPCRLDQG
jgi:hypothetical protein